MKTFFVQIFVTLGLSLIVLILFEFYLRQTSTQVIQTASSHKSSFVESDPDFLIDASSGERRLVPNADVTIRNHYLSKKDVRLQTNSLGLRSQHDLETDAFRVLVLGDSITIQDYLPQKESYVFLLENLLQTQFSKPVQVLNAGVGNTGMSEYLTRLKRVLKEQKIDVLFLALYLNDARPPWGFSGEIGNRGWFRRKSLLIETLYRSFREQSYFDKEQMERFRWVELGKTLNWKNSSDDFMQLVEAAKFDWGEAWGVSKQENNVFYVKTSNFLKEVSSLAEEHNFTVMTTLFPVSFQVESELDKSTPQRTIEELSAKFDFQYVDLLSSLRKKKDEVLFYDQCHPTFEGNKIIAVTLATSFLSYRDPEPIPKEEPRESLNDVANEDRSHL